MKIITRCAVAVLIVLATALLDVHASQSVPSLLWTKTYNSGGQDLLSGLALDVYGNSFAVGTSIVGSPRLVLVMKWDTAGNLIWSKTFDAGHGNNWGKGVAADAAGNAYVAAYGSNGMNQDLYLVKYSASGAVVWQSSYDSGREDLASGVAIDQAGNLYLSATSSNGTVSRKIFLRCM